MEWTTHPQVKNLTSSIGVENQNSNQQYSNTALKIQIQHSIEIHPTYLQLIFLNSFILYYFSLFLFGNSLECRENGGIGHYKSNSRI